MSVNQYWLELGLLDVVPNGKKKRVSRALDITKSILDLRGKEDYDYVSLAYPVIVEFGCEGEIDDEEIIYIIEDFFEFYIKNNDLNWGSDISDVKIMKAFCDINIPYFIKYIS